METYRGEMLRESFNYKGTMFWENYMLSNIIRTVSRDLKKYEDPNLVIEMYQILYGEETIELFEDMVNNEKILHEVAEVKGTLLFEGVGEKNFNVYLRERTFSKFASKILPASTTVGAATAPVGFLKGLWSKFKGLFSSGTFATIGAFLKSGFGWAKDLVRQGAEWVSATPIVNVAVPMLMVAGGLKAAKILVNKMRRKTGKGKMSSSEESQFDEIAVKNKDKVEKARQKVLKKAA